MKTKEKLTNDQRELLRAPFPEEAIKVHDSKSYLSTLKAIYVVERLNDVLGIGRWDIKHEVVERTENYVLIKGKFHSEDYDIIVPDQYGGHKTEGKGTEIADGYKSAVTDCLSKIASYLEVGIDVFKGKVNVSNTQPQKPWLNIYVKGTKNLTPEMETVYNNMLSGSFKNISQIEKSFKINKANRATIEAWFVKINKKLKTA